MDALVRSMSGEENMTKIQARVEVHGAVGAIHYLLLGINLLSLILLLGVGAEKLSMWMFALAAAAGFVLFAGNMVLLNRVIDRMVALVQETDHRKDEKSRGVILVGCEHDHDD